MTRDNSRGRRKILRAASAAVLALGFVPAQSLHAADGVWQGGTDWNVDANWLPGPAPAAGDTATFNGSSGLNVANDARGILNINFDTAAAGAFVIGSTAGPALTLGDGGAITSTGSVVTTQTVNAPLILGGSSYTFANNAAANANLLNIGGAISAAGGTATLTLSGSNLLAFPNNGAPFTNQITGVIGNGGGVLALNKTDAGSWTLSGANTYTGGTTVNAGVLAIRHNSALGTGDVNVAAGASLQFTTNGLAVANNITLNGLTVNGAGQGGALVGGVASGTNTTTLNGTLTLAATSNVTSYWADKTLVLAGKVTGPGGLQVTLAQSGNGVPNVSLTNATNDFTGGVFLNSGFLIFSPNTLGSGNITFGGGSLRWAAGNTQDISAKIAPIPSGINAGFDTNNQNVTLASAFGGAGGITKVGAGILTLDGLNFYTGPTNINGGTLSVATIADAGGSNIGTGGTVTINGGTLRYTGAAPATTNRAFNANNANLANTIEVSNAAAGLEIGGSFAGNTAGRVTKTGPGALTLSGAGDNASLLINVQAGTVNLNKSVAGGVRAVAGISGIATGATVRLTGSADDQIYGGAGTYNAGAPTNGMVHMTGGTFDLNGRSEGFDRVIGNGVITNDGASGITSTLTLGESGSDPAGGSLFAGVIKDGAAGGKVALTKVGVGVQSLTGANTYTGATTISGGTLRLGVSTASVPVAGAKIWLDASDTPTVVNTAGAVSQWTDKSGNGNHAVQSDPAKQPALTTNANVGGKSVVRFDASGDVFDAPINTVIAGKPYTIFVVEGKTGTGNHYFLGTTGNSTNNALHVGYRDNDTYTLAQYSNDMNYDSAALAYVAPNQVFRVWGNELTTTGQYGGHLITLNSEIVGSNTNTTVLGTGTGAGRIGQGYSVGGQQYVGDLGEILIFDVGLSPEQRGLVNAYLQQKWLGAPDVLPTTTAVNITASGATLDVGEVHQAIGSLSGVSGSVVSMSGGSLAVGDATSTTFAGSITGSGALTKQGAGTLLLNGANTFAGDTLVTGGTLGGTGSLAGALLVTSGGTVAPGNSVGTFAAGDLTLQPGATYAVELDGSAATADLLNITGGVTLSDSLLSIALLSPPTEGQQFLIIANDGTSDAVVGTFANAGTLTAGGFNFLVNTAGGDGNDVVLTATAIPEPATLGAVGLAAIGLLARRRRGR